MKSITFLPGFFLLVICLLIGLATDSVSAETVDDSVQPVSITVTPLERVLVRPVSSVPATVIGLNHAVISAEITGRAVKLTTDTGDSVKNGQMLARIDCRTYELALEQARAGLKIARTRLELTKKQFARNQRLLKKGTISRERYDQVEADRKTALADIELKKVAIETAALSVSRCLVKAPFDGQITRREVQLGQLLTPGAPLFKLLQSESLEVSAKLSAAELNDMQTVSDLMFVVSGKHYPVALRSVIDLIDEATRTREVRLLFLQKKRPESSMPVAGLSGRLEWVSTQPRLPADFVVMRNNTLGVMLVKRQTVSRSDSPTVNTEREGDQTDLTEAEKAGANTGRGITLFHPLPQAVEGQTALIDLPADTLLVEQNRFRVQNGQTVTW